MTLSLTNRTGRKLRVVLPPGLIVSNATSQFGGMGGFGGGMGGMMGGGMGMMGGGMGMMGGGMGMMGGGMGMMGGGMGGMGGGMMGGGMGMRGGGMGMRGGGTMPASMGMMMLGRLIMTLIGDRDSWDQRSLMMGMMMGMGGGMGMMGGGMGMMGGMGGGFRSVPATGLPETTLAPHQSRHLPTAVVGLSGPIAERDGRPLVPELGEKYRVGSITEVTEDSRTQAAMKRLAEDKAPQTVAQLVLWNVAAKIDWETIGRLSQAQGWANANELALARQFVDRLDSAADSSPNGDSGRLYWEAKSSGVESEALVERLRSLWSQYPVLGLKPHEGIPAHPEGPALACRLKVDDQSISVEPASTDGDASAWQELTPFTIKRADITPVFDNSTTDKPSRDKVRLAQAARLGDAVAEGLLTRLVRVHLSKGPRVNGKLSYKIKIENGSPLILNGLALAGTEVSAENPPAALAGFCLPPRKTLTAPANADTVDRLKLKHGVRVIAADLSGL